MSGDTGRSDLTTGAATTAVPPRPGLFGSIAHRLAGDAAELPIEGHLASFDGATGWLNSAPLTPEGLRGRVVLVDFWTYTCVNWLRTLPYVRAWDARYRSQGLTVIGVHTPEFEFEHSVDNVIAQSRTFGVEYPIAVDSDYGVWRAFGNHFWPAIYLADAQGRIRFHHFGEGEYAMTEMAIQQLLLDAGAADVDPALVSVDPRGLEVAADYRSLRSPETYLGYGQATGFASPDGLREDQAHDYAAPHERWASTTGRRPERGRSPTARLCWPDPADGSRSASRHATSISSWVQPRDERPSRSACAWTADRPTRRTDPTLTPTATAR